MNWFLKPFFPQVLFDHMGCLKRYDSVHEILKEFFELRLQYYKLRKDWLLGSLGAEASKLSNQARFVLEKIEGKVSIGKNALLNISSCAILSTWLNWSVCFYVQPFFFLFFFQRTNQSVNWSACWSRKALNLIQWWPGPKLRRRYFFNTSDIHLRTHTLTLWVLRWVGYSQVHLCLDSDTIDFFFCNFASMHNLSVYEMKQSKWDLSEDFQI